MSEGWIKLYRKLTDNPLWKCEKFTRGQAWVDLILLANHEYGYFYLRNHKIEVQRGQVGWSQLKLAERWKWSRSKVKKFLNDMEKEQQVVQQQSKSTSIITIINYETYQQKGQQVVQQQDNSRATAEQQQDTNKKDKNEKTVKNVKNKDSTHIISLKKELFQEQINPYIEVYENEMLQEFSNYWCETNKSLTKLRWELEKTWDVNLRLQRWAKNYKPEQTRNGAEEYKKELELKIERKKHEN